VSVDSVINRREADPRTQDETATLTIIDGSVELKDQLRDYKYRGEELESMNFLQFMLDTYEAAKEDKEDDMPVEVPTDGPPTTRGPRRPLSTRIPYQDEAGKGKRSRIKRQQGHETLPRIVGKWFCRSDNDLERDLFRASMLMLLKPWRKLHELKSITETFESAYEQFTSQADERWKRVIANVQYYYECSDGAKTDREKAQTSTQEAGTDSMAICGVDIGSDEEEEVEDHCGHPTALVDITDEDLERAVTMRTPAKERLYGESAVALG